MSRMTLRLLSVAIAVSGIAACAQPADDGAPEASHAFTESDALQLENLVRTVEILHEKFTALAEAMPEEDLAWRPMDGVRSVEEVFIHVAADNWWVPAMMGWEAPPETNVTADAATFTTYQEQTMTREEMIEAVDASFLFFLESMRDSAGDLDRGVSLRGTPAVVGDIWIRATVHLHEHMGQMIAYARANEVVPPWSR